MLTGDHVGQGVLEIDPATLNHDLAYGDALNYYYINHCSDIGGGKKSNSPCSVQYLCSTYVGDLTQTPTLFHDVHLLLKVAIVTGAEII